MEVEQEDLRVLYQQTLSQQNMSVPQDSTRAYTDFDIRSPFRSYFRVGRDLLVEPETFFRAVRGGGFWGPTSFAFVTYLLLYPLSALLVFAPVLIYVIPTVVQQNLAAYGSKFLMYALIVVVVILIFMALSGVLSTFLGALIWHPFVALSVGVGRGAGFRETYRIAAYQSLPYVVGSFIPLIGILLAVGGMSYVGIFGVKGAHGTTTTRAIISVAVPLALTFLLFVTALIAVFVLANDSSL